MFLYRPTKLELYSSSCLIFYSAPQCSHCKRCTSYGSSVCLSVRLSHAGIVSKRLHASWCSLRCQFSVAPFSFRTTNIIVFTFSSSLTSLGLFVCFQFSLVLRFSSRSAIIVHHAIYILPPVVLHYLPHHVFHVPPFLPPCSLVFPPSLFHVIFHRSLQRVTSHALPYRLSPVLAPHPHSIPFLSAVHSPTHPLLSLSSSPRLSFPLWRY